MFRVDFLPPLGAKAPDSISSLVKLFGKCPTLHFPCHSAYILLFLSLLLTLPATSSFFSLFLFSRLVFGLPLGLTHHLCPVSLSLSPSVYVCVCINLQSNWVYTSFSMDEENPPFILYSVCFAQQVAFIAWLKNFFHGSMKLKKNAYVIKSIKKRERRGGTDLISWGLAEGCRLHQMLAMIHSVAFCQPKQGESDLAVFMSG